MSGGEGIKFGGGLIFGRSKKGFFVGREDFLEMGARDFSCILVGEGFCGDFFYFLSKK